MPTPTPTPLPAIEWLAGSSAAIEGRHRIDPGAPLTLTLSATPDGDAADATLILVVPDGWAVVDAADGWATATEVRWPGLTLVAGKPVERSVVVRAPKILPGAVSATATFSWRIDISAAKLGDPVLPLPGPSLTVLVAPRLVVESVTIGQVPAPGEDATYLGPGEPVTGQPRFEVFRVRFIVGNPDTLDVQWTPQVAFSPADGAGDVPVPDGYVPVPEKASKAGSPFYAATEWVRVPGPPGTEPPGLVNAAGAGARGAARGAGGPDRLDRPGPDGTRPEEAGRWGGTLPGPDREVLPPGQARVRGEDASAQPEIAARGGQIDGLRSMGINPMPALTLPGDGLVEVEFSLRATADADYLASYLFALTDAGETFAGAAEASVTMQDPPALELSPGQRSGISAAAVEPVGAVAGVAYPLELPGAGPSAEPAALVTPAAVETSGSTADLDVQYQLLAPDAVEGLVQPLANGTLESPHTDYSLTTDACAACHRTHVAANNLLLTEPVTQATLCFSCHDGSGSSLDIAAQYADPAVPANDETERAYYRHDALLAPTNHTIASDNEFGGVLERHSECVDCHNSHNASPVDAVETATGWTVSGRLASVSGVSVANGAAGEAPTYTFLDGTVTAKPTREFELCLKCHSSFTTLPSNDGQPASRWWLDKGLELNPANPAFHPIEAPGTNTSPAMAAGLVGTSPYKQWDFTPESTVRCVNCHADSRAFDPAAAPPAAGAALENHASLARGILRQPYRDGTYVGATPEPGQGLKPALEPYAAADFALCYMCHAEAPFVNRNPDDLAQTNFGWHGYHLRSIENEGNGGLDIDTAGAGQGNAICAECHFRIHSNALAVREGDRDNARLVNFAPNVQPYNGTLEWAAQPAGGATCTLTCHGETHNAEGYPKP